ncbi:MAG: NAD(P)-dependent oxidoreductase [Mycobacterium sp.]
MIVTVVGLGIMGAPMARNLRNAGHDVIGVNRSPAPVERFVADGGRTTTLEEAIRQSDVVLTMVPDSADAEAVLTGDAGAFAFARPDTLFIDASSIAPETARSLSAEAISRGLRMIDAPVSGGEQGAIDATLSIMVGGTAADVEAAMPVLTAVGSTIVHVGPAGAGQTVKAANQLLVAGIIELVSEALVFVDAHGVELERAVEVLAGGLAGNRILDRKAQGMLAHRFEPGFRITLHHKDLGIFSEAARQAGVVTPLGAVVTQLMASAVANGDGDLDHSALLRGVERLSGR